MIDDVSFAENSIICMEECAELIKVVSKLFRSGFEDPEKRKGNRQYQKLWEDLREEMADVMICIDLLKRMYDISDIYLEDMIRHKMYRNIRRLEHGDENGETIGV